MLVDLHDRRLVAAAVAVVRCREDGDHVLVVAPAEAVHDQLVSPGDQRQPVRPVELLRDVLAEGVAAPSGWVSSGEGVRMRGGGMRN